MKKEMKISIWKEHAELDGHWDYIRGFVIVIWGLLESPCRITELKV